MERESRSQVRRAMISLPDDVAEFIRVQCAGRTDESLQRQFGISYNTWRRIESGAPIRQSLALRLIAKTADARAEALGRDENFD